MREKGIHKIEVHVAGLCIKKDNNKLKILVGKRSPNRALFPNYWECGGGQVKSGENFISALKRQMKGEFNIDIEVGPPLEVYDIKTQDSVIPGVRFICLMTDENQAVSISEEFTDYRWIDEEKIDSYDFIPGLKERLKSALATYRILNQCLLKQC